MALVTVNDSATGQYYSYDDAPIMSADSGLAFYMGQLTNMEAKIYEAKYRNIIYDQLIPVDTSDPEWVDTVGYLSFDGVTMGKFIAANGKDLPQSDIDASMSQIKVGYAGNSFGYSVEELRKSHQLRIPLDAAKGKMSLRGAQEHIQVVAFYGDAARGMFGLLNHPNVPIINDGLVLATANGDELAALLNKAVNTVWLNSGNVHMVDTLIVPQELYLAMTNKRMPNNANETAMTFFMRSNTYTTRTGQQLNIVPLIEASTAGVGGKPRIIAYEKNPENLTMRMPIPWRPLAPQMHGLRVDVPCEYKFSGTEFRFPGSATYVDLTA